MIEQKFSLACIPQKMAKVRIKAIRQLKQLAPNYRQQQIFCSIAAIMSTSSPTYWHLSCYSFSAVQVSHELRTEPCFIG